MTDTSSDVDCVRHGHLYKETVCGLDGLETSARVLERLDRF